MFAELLLCRGSAANRLIFHYEYFILRNFYRIIFPMCYELMTRARNFSEASLYSLKVQVSNLFESLSSFITLMRLLFQAGVEARPGQYFC